MNKAFKVLWNDVRGSYVVSSENHLSHGKPARVPGRLLPRQLPVCLPSVPAQPSQPRPP